MITSSPSKKLKVTAPFTQLFEHVLYYKIYIKLYKTVNLFYIFIIKNGFLEDMNLWNCENYCDTWDTTQVSQFAFDALSWLFFFMLPTPKNWGQTFNDIFPVALDLSSFARHFWRKPEKQKWSNSLMCRLNAVISISSHRHPPAPAPPLCCSCTHIHTHCFTV